jgi:hypothetical protein
MKKKTNLKLSLSLETVLPLQLDHVNGGAAGTTATTTIATTIITRISCLHLCASKPGSQ